MALTIALPLSGLEPEHFCARGVRILYEQGLRCLAGNGPISPSTASESSGISSLPSGENDTPGLTPDTSRPCSPVSECNKNVEKPNEPIKVIYKERDILNLGANLRGPFWQMRNPAMPRYNFKTFMANRSVYFRLGDYGLTEDYPTSCCDECGFSEPSLFQF